MKYSIEKSRVPHCQGETYICPCVLLEPWMEKEWWNGMVLAPLFIASPDGISSKGGFLFLSYLIFLRLSNSVRFASNIFYLWALMISYSSFASSGRVLGI